MYEVLVMHLDGKVPKIKEVFFINALEVEP